MKHYKTTGILCLLIILPCCSIFSQAKDSVFTIEEWDELWRYKNFYISSQPEEEELEWLMDKGVNSIINLRSNGEIDEFKEDGFNEKKKAKKLQMKYAHIPIKGSSGYTPDNLARLVETIQEGDTVLIHCASGGRATQFFMAYLYKAHGYSLNDAVSIGKEMMYYVPLEDILDQEISFEPVEKNF